MRCGGTVKVLRSSGAMTTIHVEALGRQGDGVTASIAGGGQCQKGGLPEMKKNEMRKLLGTEEK
jgi:hypothetical protein